MGVGRVGQLQAESSGQEVSAAQCVEKSKGPDGWNVEGAPVRAKQGRSNAQQAEWGRIVSLTCPRAPGSLPKGFKLESNGIRGFRKEGLERGRAAEEGAAVSRQRLWCLGSGGGWSGFEGYLGAFDELEGLGECEE